MSDYDLDLQQQKNEELDATYWELKELGLIKKEPLILDLEIEQTDGKLGKRLMNYILWGNEKGYGKM